MVESWHRPEIKRLRASYDHLFRRSLSLTRLREAALDGRLFDRSSSGNQDGVVGRSMAWKLFLIPTEPLSSVAPESPARSPIPSLRTSRTKFVQLLQEKLRAPDGSYEEGLLIPGLSRSSNATSPNLDIHNPLSLAEDNQWKQYYKNLELRNTIKQDVERTFPDIQYFQNSDVQLRLTIILYIYSVMHLDIGYRQGMHEILAPIYYALDYDSISEDFNADKELKEFCSRTWLDADAWILFDLVMQSIGSWYEWQEPEKISKGRSVVLSPGNNGANSNGAIKVFVAPIVCTCQYMQSTLLKVADPNLWQSMEATNIEPQIYGIRWLRLLFTREFGLQDAMIIWDGLFASADIAELAPWICIAMLIRIRNDLIPADYGSQLTHLLRYPSLQSLTSQNSHYTSLLVRQALTLRTSPNPSTGASVMVENKNLLGISVDVLSSPPNEKRRQVKALERPKSATNLDTGSMTTGALHGHRKDDSIPQHMSFSETLARGFLERGESLGINKTVMSAVSELRKNLPDISSHLTRPAPDSSTVPSFPMTPEKGSRTKLTWEPRNRFELDREIAELRNMQKLLGESVGWAVDTLLQDEDVNYGQDKLKTIRLQKREALESLSYVRDVLNGSINSIEEDQLFSEEEYKQRRRRALSKEQSISPANRFSSDAKITVAPWVSLPRPVIAIDSESGHQRSDSQSRSPQSSFISPTQSTLTSPPSAVLSSALSYFTEGSSFPSAKSDPQSPSSTLSALAPWNHTSTFSVPSIDPSSLPRPPPKTSTTTLVEQAPGRAHIHTLSRPNAVSGQAPTEELAVNRDPLGVLR